MGAVRISPHSGYVGLHELFVMDCARCGEVFAVTSVFYTLRRRDGVGFSCPNGHSNVFSPGKSAEQRRIDELEQEVRRAKEEAATATRSRELAESRAKGANIQAGKARAAKERLEHRIACGVCPHCQRTFKQLAAHMKSKHPVKQ